MLLRGKYKIRKDKQGIDRLVIFDLSKSIRDTLACRSYKRILIYLPVYEIYDIELQGERFKLFCNKNDLDFISGYIYRSKDFERYRYQLVNHINYPFDFWYEYEHDFMLFKGNVDIKLLTDELRKDAKHEIRLVVPIKNIKIGHIFSTITGEEYLKVNRTDCISLKKYFAHGKVELLNWDLRTPVMKLNQSQVLRNYHKTVYDIMEIITLVNKLPHDHYTPEDNYQFATEITIDSKKQELQINIISINNLIQQNYKIMAIPSWISFNQSTKKFTVTENGTGSQRQGTITLKQSTSNKTVEIVIKQLAKSYTFAWKTSAPTPTVDAYAEAGVSFDLSTLESQINSYLLGTAEDYDAHVAKAMTWAIKSQSVASTATIAGKVLNFTENEDNKTRTVVAEATQEESGLKLEVTITQSAATWEYTFTCASEEISINYAAQEIDPQITSTKLINGHKTVEVGYDVVNE
jgi:hypothetical protein